MTVNQPRSSQNWRALVESYRSNQWNQAAAASSKRGTGNCNLSTFRGHLDPRPLESGVSRPLSPATHDRKQLPLELRLTISQKSGCFIACGARSGCPCCQPISEFALIGTACRETRPPHGLRGGTGQDMESAAASLEPSRSLRQTVAHRMRVSA